MSGGGTRVRVKTRGKNLHEADKSAQVLQRDNNERSESGESRETLGLDRLSVCVCVCAGGHAHAHSVMAVEFQIKFGQVGSKFSSNWAVTYGTDGINETLYSVCVCLRETESTREREKESREIKGGII